MGYTALLFPVLWSTCARQTYTYFVVHLPVHGIRPINWNKTAFEQLVLPKRTKNLIKGLVMVGKQASEDPESALRIGLGGGRDDIIAGKGSGLIMLLHGGPGTGKTLTAGTSFTNSNLL
jgi:hypothetical protein